MAGIVDHHTNSAGQIPQHVSCIRTVTLVLQPAERTFDKPELTDYDILSPIPIEVRLGNIHRSHQVPADSGKIRCRGRRPRYPLIDGSGPCIIRLKSPDITG